MEDKRISFGFLTNPLFAGSDSKHLPCKVYLNQTSVNVEWVDWCHENCQEEWGWFFNKGNSIAVMTFASSREAIWFKVRNLQ